VAPGGEGEAGLAYAVAFDDSGARDAFVAALRPALGSFPAPARLEALEVDGVPAALLRVGLELHVEVAVAPMQDAGEGV
jgi:hypothetical protein